MLRSISLRNKLLLAVGLPMILLAIAAGTTLRSAQTDAQQATEQAERVDADLKVLGLAASLRAEQTAGLDGNQEELVAARERTDLSFEEAIDSTLQSRFLLERMLTENQRIRNGLGDNAVAILSITVQEQAADSTENTPTLDLQEDFADLATRPLILIEGSTDSYKTGRTATQVSAVSSLVKWGDAILTEQGLVNVLLDQDTLVEDQRRRLLERAIIAEQAQDTALSNGLEDFDMSEAVELPANAALYDYRDRIRSNDPDAIETVDPSDVASDGNLLLEAIATEREILIDQIDEENVEALAQATRAQRVILAATVLVIAGTAVILFALYRAITTPITQLSNRGRKISNEDLPMLVSKIRSGETNAGDHEIIPLESQTDDEIGELVTVFNELHSTAVGMAAEQAQSRQHAAEMFVNLGRRNQKILDTVLRDLDVLEHDEEDPNRLSQLYLVDQKVTRMRRNAESLLVLAGTQTPRQWAQPAQLGDVVRAAMSEVENFERVEQTVDNSIQVPGNAVADLTHLLAELIENALRFSPPDETVLVHSAVVGNQNHILVSDRGFGMKADKLEAANNQIEEAATNEETPSKHLGLYVVGRLATRHGIIVSLDTGESDAGLTAQVNLNGLTKTLSDSDSDDSNDSNDSKKESPKADNDNDESSAEPVITETQPVVAVASSDDDKMPDIEPAVPRSEEVSSHVEQASKLSAQAKPKETQPATETKPATETQPASRAQPDFAEMTKPRAPKRRVPGAALPSTLQTPTSDAAQAEATTSRPEDVRDAFSGFQKSSGSISKAATKTSVDTKSPAATATSPEASSTQASAPNAERRGQPDFAEMTKPRAPKRRVPGATLPGAPQKRATDSSQTEATTSRPEDVRDAFSGFQKSASKPSTNSDKTESDES